MSRIEVSNLVKIYRAGEVDVPALRGVSLRIESGDFVAITGASGSGKSTLLHIVGCLDQPTRGTVRLGEYELSSASADELAFIRNRQIGFVFQSFNLLARTSAAENVELPLLYAGVPAAERRARVAQALAAVGLSDRAHHTPNQLSGGQQQRVAIARALVVTPSVVLADEPTGNLDSASSDEVMRLLESLNRDGITIVMVTHEADIAARARRVIAMRDGQVVSDHPCA